MNVGDMSKEQKAQILGAVGRAVEATLGTTLFFMLVVDGSGNMCDVKNIPRAAVPRLLREYADLIERKK